MQATTTAQPVVGSAGTTEVTTTFTDLPGGLPDVEIAVRVWQGTASVWKGPGDTSPAQTLTHTSGVYRVTLVDERGVTDESMRRVARLLPQLTEQATNAASTPDLFPSAAFPWADLMATTVGREVLRVSGVYVEAVKNRERPMKAVMEQLHMSRATAARRIREAKDRGLLPERERDV